MDTMILPIMTARELIVYIGWLRTEVENQAQ